MVGAPTPGFTSAGTPLSTYSGAGFQIRSIGIDGEPESWITTVASSCSVMSRLPAAIAGLVTTMRFEPSSYSIPYATCSQTSAA